MGHLFADQVVSRLPALFIFRKNREGIQGIGLAIPDEVFAYGSLLEPLFTLISEFEERKMRFYMRERKLTKFYARMIALERKYANIPFVESHAKLLRYHVYLRFSQQNHYLSLVADRLTLHPSPRPETLIPDLTPFSSTKYLTR
jgi:hypothetical protein